MKTLGENWGTWNWQILDDVSRRASIHCSCSCVPSIGKDSRPYWEGPWRPCAAYAFQAVCIHIRTPCQKLCWTFVLCCDECGQGSPICIAPCQFDPHSRHALQLWMHSGWRPLHYKEACQSILLSCYVCPDEGMHTCSRCISTPPCMNPPDIQLMTLSTQGLHLVSNPLAHLLQDLQTAVPALALLHRVKL